jgi:hypothetical protein
MNLEEDLVSDMGAIGVVKELDASIFPMTTFASKLTAGTIASCRSGVYCAAES